MPIIKLGYNPQKKFKWEQLSNEYSGEKYNGKIVVQINGKLWEKVKNIMKITSKGFQAPILIDGGTRTGKSTLGKTIAYLINPKLSIDNYVPGIEEAPDKIDKANDGDVLVFDEGSLIASSKDAMRKQNKQLEKIIDVCGIKRLTLIFCMPSFFKISHSIAVQHSLFLIHVYTDKKLNRGRFIYFSTKKKKLLYLLGKKNYGSYKKPRSDFKGLFVDFRLPFEEEYEKIKAQSLREAINPNAKKGKVMNESDYKTKFIVEFKKNNPEVTDKNIWKGFGISSSEYYRRKQAYRAIHTPQTPHILY